MKQKQIIFLGMVLLVVSCGTQRYITNTNEDFKMTSAHEIGYEILLAFGGHKYSKSHKGSSTIITQKDKNTPLPQKGEIDLMKYYKKTVGHNHKKNIIASDQDVLEPVDNVALFSTIDDSSQELSNHNIFSDKKGIILIPKSEVSLGNHKKIMPLTTIKYIFKKQVVL